MAESTARTTSKSKKRRSPAKVPIEQYEHKKEKRANNPEAGLVTSETDPGGVRKTYSFDPHLSPELNWAGKAETESVTIPTVSLHVHERIDPRTIIEHVRKTNTVDYEQMSMFNPSKKIDRPENEIEFYKHQNNWANRLVSGDSLMVMNSLLEKEGMGEKFQMLYFDPPYGIKYGSNFQPFTGKRDVKDGSDSDLSSEPETLKAFRDTWELGIHSYLSYLRSRLYLARDLLAKSGSIFLQISDENVHLVRMLMDEIFGSEQFLSQIYFQTTTGFESNKLSRMGDILLWYCKDHKSVKFRRLYIDQDLTPGEKTYHWVFEEDGTQRSMTKEEKEDPSKLPLDCKIYKADNIKSSGASSSPQNFKHKGKEYLPGSNHHWKTTVEGMKNLAIAKRIHVAKNSIQYRRLINDFPFQQMTNVWNDTGTGSFLDSKVFVVQTSAKVIRRCLQMTTDPGDLVFDPTCGSGTTAVVAEELGRRWVTCDTSRVAVTIAKQRIMTSQYEYYNLAHPTEGVDSGFEYKQVPHITLGSVAKNPEIKKGMSDKEIEEVIHKYAPKETLYTSPIKDNSKARVSGPFTVEAVPSPIIKPLGLVDNENRIIDSSISRSGETLRQKEWIEELTQSGIRGKGKQRIELAWAEVFTGARWLHVKAESKGKGPKNVAISFGPEHAPLEARQIDLAVKEVKSLKDRPEILVFAAFQFDPEAAKRIDQFEDKNLKIIRVQMNSDLLVDDLKKKQTGQDVFWLVGQPDISLKEIKKGENKGHYQVEVTGFDYFDVKAGQVKSGNKNNIAMWMLDSDYDGRSIFPKQVFFPMAGKKDGWGRLAASLKTEIDEDLIEAYWGTTSIPFKTGKNKRIAVKIVDDRGIESIKVIEL